MPNFVAADKVETNLPSLFCIPHFGNNRRTGGQVRPLDSMPPLHTREAKQPRHGGAAPTSNHPRPPRLPSRVRAIARSCTQLPRAERDPPHFTLLLAISSLMSYQVRARDASATSAVVSVVSNAVTNHPIKFSLNIFGLLLLFFASGFAPSKEALLVSSPRCCGSVAP